MTPIADDTNAMTWICPNCGKRPWAYAEWCACGAPRPPPAPDDGSRADEPPPDLPPVSGAPGRPGGDGWDTWRRDDRQNGWVPAP